MNKFLLFIVLISVIAFDLSAQSKKELQAEVERLRTEISEKDAALSESRKTESISVAKAEQFEAQVSELQAANATLLNNLKVFTEASTQRSESIGQTLESLRQKEAQLKVINDEFNKNDSVALLVLTGFKQTLGENAKIGVQEGAVTVELDRSTMFGTAAGSVEISDDGKAFLSKIAAVLKANRDTEATLLGFQDSITDAALFQQRRNALFQNLNEASVEDIDRVQTATRPAAVESYQIRIHPNLNGFYLRVRETVKRSR